MALILSVISCSLHSYIYVITIQDSFRPNLFHFSLLPSIPPIFPYLNLKLGHPSCFVFFFFFFLPQHAWHSPIQPCLCSPMMQQGPFPSPCYITAPLWCAFHFVNPPPTDKYVVDHPSEISESSKQSDHDTEISK